MNTNPQLDLHPDAESLSAFAEHQLPEHERQPILAHLATCAQCRQILFLAQDSVEEEQHPTAAPVLVFPQRKPATNLRYAWGALAACAALATISIVFYPRHHAIPQQQAIAVAPRPTPATRTATPQVEEKKAPSQPPIGSISSTSHPRPASAPAPKPATSLDLAVASPPLDKPAAQPLEPQQQAAAGASTTLNITLKPAASSQTVEVQAANQPLVDSEAANISVVDDKVQLEAATPPVTETMNAQVVQPKDQIELKSRTVRPLDSVQPAPKAAAASGGAGSGMTHDVGGSLHAGAVGHPAASGAAPGRPALSFAKIAPRPLVVTPEDETAAHNAQGKILPSGLAAVATASANHHLLAIDSAGSLFLSEDAGAVWEPVSAQWTGRAVQVLSPKTSTDQVNSLAIAGRATIDQASPAATAAPAPAPSPALFEIVTDQGVHWTSPDGRAWKAK